MTARTELIFHKSHGDDSPPDLFICIFAYALIMHLSDDCTVGEVGAGGRCRDRRI